jgi:SHS2 domain-containing protein
MRTFKILSHTADFRLKVIGDSVEELFRVAVEGMARIQKPNINKILTEDRKLKIQVTIKVKSSDLTSLLIDFLSEILAQSNINKAIFIEVNFIKLSETELVAKVNGIKINDFNRDIKAVTYHEAEIKKNKKNQWETIIVFDI